MARPKDKNKYYFDEIVEQAVQDYNAEIDQIKKEKIFNDKLAMPIYKLAECIVNRFKFYWWCERDGAETAILETYTHAVSILPFIDKSKGRAYSYLSLSCKRYGIQRNDEVFKHRQKCISIDDSIAETNDLHIELPMIEPDSAKEGVTDLTKFFYIFRDYIKENKEEIAFNDRDLVLIDIFVDLMNNINNLDFNSPKNDWKDCRGRHIIWRELNKQSGFKTSLFNGCLKRLKRVEKRLYKQYLNEN